MDPMKSAPMALARLARALTYLAYAFVIVALVILAFGFFLLLFGANPDAPFAEWVYRALRRVMAPFRGLFEPVRLDGRSVLDVSILFAMLVYGMAALFLDAIIDWLTARVLETGACTALRARRAGESRETRDDRSYGRG